MEQDTSTTLWHLIWFTFPLYNVPFYLPNCTNKIFSDTHMPWPFRELGFPFFTWSSKANVTLFKYQIKLIYSCVFTWIKPLPSTLDPANINQLQILHNVISQIKIDWFNIDKIWEINIIVPVRSWQNAYWSCIIRNKTADIMICQTTISVRGTSTFK